MQIFLATHDYFLPKYIEVLSSKEDEVLATEKDKVAFHALYKTDKGVKCETDGKFTLLSKNAIIKEMIQLYEAETNKGWE